MSQNPLKLQDNQTQIPFLTKFKQNKYNLLSNKGLDLTHWSGHEPIQKSFRFCSMVSYHVCGVTIMAYHYQLSQMARISQLNYKCMPLFCLIPLFLANEKIVTNFKIFESEWSSTHICKFAALSRCQLHFMQLSCQINVVQYHTVTISICCKSAATLKPLCGENKILITQPAQLHGKQVQIITQQILFVTKRNLTLLRMFFRF